MFALIKREILDHIIYFIGAAAVSALLIGASVPAILRYDGRTPPMFPVALGVSVAAIVIICICGMGAAQMYLDKTRRISAYISTLPVSRNRILIARIVAGALAILILLVPLAVLAGVIEDLFDNDHLAATGDLAQHRVASL